MGLRDLPRCPVPIAQPPQEYGRRGDKRRTLFNVITPEANENLARLHSAIDECYVCEALVGGFCKPKRLDRGSAGRVMIVGQGPGKAEVRNGRAFAGQSGKKLDEWLVRCGASNGQPRLGIYLTAVIKCVGNDRQYGVMTSNCIGFLHKQISVIRPELIITLGHRSFEALTFAGLSYEEALCRPFQTAEHLLVTPYGFDFAVLHWPHPSGLNRWLNQRTNRDRLESSFEFVRPFLEVVR